MLKWIKNPLAASHLATKGQAAKIKTPMALEEIASCESGQSICPVSALSKLAQVAPGWLSEWAPQRIVNDDRPAIGEGLDRMAYITCHDRNQTSSGDLDYAVDGHLELALDHLVNLFLKMKMLVNRRTTFKVFVAVAPACFS
jgi:hypothetical protein